MLAIFANLTHELGVVVSAVTTLSAQNQIMLLMGALLIACGFEFVNGFHDTANAVATVIYTRSLKPVPAVVWSGLCNFLGVLFGGTAVAMGIMKLLPPDLFVASSQTTALAAVFALLIGAIIWNLGTWFFALPASSSHTLIGAIIGIGVAHAVHTGHDWASGVNWGKARDIGLALLISPVLGFSLSAGLLLLIKKLSPGPALHHPASETESPPWKIRSTLIATCTGVSFVHGSNDGQKGIGLIMLILMALAPGHFALNTTPTGAKALAQLNAEFAQAKLALTKMSGLPGTEEAQRSGLLVSVANAQPAVSGVAKAPEAVATAIGKLTEAQMALGAMSDPAAMKPEDRVRLRTTLQGLDASLAKVEKAPAPGADGAAALAAIKSIRSKIKAIVEYAPTWVLMLVAFSIGLGTMIGWKRIVVTLGERIGKEKLTYAQGASAELVAMGTIGLSAAAGLPVSTTHVLSSGIAGTMVAGRAGLQSKMVEKIAAAWLLTLPMSMALSAGLYWAFLKLVG